MSETDTDRKVGEDMEYPKKLMSVSEMTKLGFSRAMLYELAHHQLAYRYIVSTRGGGKFLFDTDEFEKLRGRVCIGMRTN